jgi:hypothetical protein
MIPKARFDEVNSKAKDLERENAELKAKAEAAAANPVEGRDYEAELSALDKKYDDGDVDFATYQKESRALNREQAKAETLAEVAKQNALSEQQRSEQLWSEAKAAFFADPDNAEYASNPVRQAALSAAVQVEFQQAGGRISYADVLVKARDSVEDAFGVAKPATNSADPHAARRAKDAAAAAAASGTPAPISGGVGARASKDGKVEITSATKPSVWAKLPQVEKDRLLGITS